MTLSQRKSDEAAAAAARAHADADDAQSLLDELEQRLTTGDDTVTPDQLEEQRRLANWAKLNAQGMAAKARIAEDVAAVSSARATADHAAAIGELDQVFAKTWVVLVDALRCFYDSANQRNTAILNFVHQLEEHDADLRSRQMGSIADHGITLGLRRPGVGLRDGFAVDATGLDISHLDTSAQLNSAMRASVAGDPGLAMAVGQHGDPFPFDLVGRCVPALVPILQAKGLI